jgi:hypothetical protein
MLVRAIVIRHLVFLARTPAENGKRLHARLAERTAPM